MRMRTTNIYRRKLLRKLNKLSRETGKPLWRRIAELLDRPRRKRIAVNLSRINRCSNEGEVIIVPGRVLGAGKLKKRVTVVAESYTKKAYEKIVESGSRPLHLRDLVENSELLGEIGSKNKRILG